MMRVSFSGIKAHQRILEDEKKKLYLLRERLRETMMLDGVRYIEIQKAIDGLEKLQRNIKKRSQGLEELVMDFTQQYEIVSDVISDTQKEISALFE